MTAVNLGKIGVWTSYRPFGVGLASEAAKLVEQLGYGTWWIGASPRVPDVRPVLEATSRLVAATGILNVWANDPAETAAATAAVRAKFPGRLMLGIGVGHREATTEYRTPLATMRAFLDGLDASATPPPPEERCLAALGPKMLALARDVADGAHPYNTTVAQTAEARAVLGPHKLLCVEQKVLLETNAARAREIARAYLRPYLRLPNYVNSWRRAGFDDSDFTDNGSNRLVDTLVAWGDEDALVARVREHWQAGADHVCIQALYADPGKSTLDGPNIELIRHLAPLARESNTSP